MSSIICVALAIIGVDNGCQVRPLFNETSGWLSQYGKTPTVATIEYRQQMGEIPLNLSSYDGLLAVANCAWIGDEVLLSVEDGPWMKMLVFDCAGNDGTPQWMRENNIIGEVDYFTAKKLNIIGQGGIQARFIHENITN